MQKSKMFFEDFEVGLVIKTGSKKITKKEIISFAKSYDPQDFHIDENKAKKGVEMAILIFLIFCF